MLKKYAAYNGKKLSGVKYEQFVVTEAVAIKAMNDKISALEAKSSRDNIIFILIGSWMLALSTGFAIKLWKDRVTA